MDVYGFYGANCPYPYNQPDELTKQMYAQQAMAPYVPFTPTPENNLAGGPWNSRGLAWGMQSPPHLVHFTGQTPFKDENGVVLHSKRKSLDVEPVVPAKQLITEEKMAAHLSGLHISSDYTTHSNTESMDFMIDTRDEGLVEKVKGHTIVLSEEVKRLQEEPLLPAVLIEKLQKPTMSLVVWKPREDILEQIKEESKKEDEKPVKRNGVLVDNSNNNDVDMWTSPSQWN